MFQVVKSFVICGQISGCFWCYFSGNWITEDFDRYLHFIYTSLNSVKVQQENTALTIVNNSRALTKSQRIAMRDAVYAQESQAAKLCGHAIVMNSWFDRMSTRALRLIFPPPYEEHMFSSPDRALVWLKTKSNTFNPSLVWQAILVSVPNENLFW